MSTIALIGCGSMGVRHARALLAARDLAPRLTHVCDRDPVRAGDVASLVAEAGFERPRVCADVEELFADPGLDAVIVVLPTSAHHDVCLSALRSGKHVLVEKPLALTPAQAIALAEAADRHQRVLSVAENYRRLPANRALRGLLDDAGGAISMTTDIVCSPRLERQLNGADWYGDPAIAGSYLAHEMGAHEIDLTRYLLGEIESVSCVARCAGPDGDPRRAEELVATLRCASGAVAQLNLRSSEHEQPGGDRRIVLENGSVDSAAWEVWDGRHVDRAGRPTTTDEVLRHRYAESGLVEPVRPLFDRSDVTRSGTVSVLREFLDSVAGHAEPEIDGWDGARTLAACEALIASASTGQAVRPADLVTGLR
ncbi:Gfo/Idh/MocA family protein [Prauserella cavernicola]|uniref:Gfo/Idh/MocA family oxidoreductase n=1 Tax=Prauserella cavernicola TaxID=2800127 RepID=A0A934QVW6_9PSEU|nr:Gfo/Idh/MocA family oxidoreductase [Prauserella cavernicola]MBK1787530.1 Gfo/Idh/MocA family oxidoreductase [Prauserella cavernicola]